MDTLQLIEVLRRAANAMSAKADINDVLFEVAVGVTECLGAQAAGVCLAGEDGRLEFVTASDQRLVELERVQQAEQKGPCVLAFQSGENVAIFDISDELTMWPDFQAAAARASLNSVLGLPLTIGKVRVGSLNIYDEFARTWTPDDQSTGRALAEIATSYLIQMGELAQSKKLAAQLQQALDSRVIIEQAKGILSRANSISIDAAFALLRNQARSTRTPLASLAARVVHDGLRLQ